ncbi:MAG: MinD/ParA family protein [Rubrivivax sp.]
MEDLIGNGTAWTVDQADGLRRMFARSTCVILPLVSNPHVGAGGVGVEQLTAVLALQGRKTLVVDAAETSPPPSEASVLDLDSCIEHLSPSIAYMAAQGLPRRFVNTRGSSARLLDELTRLVPDAQAVLLHASAPDLVRLCSGRALRPLVMAGDDQDSVKHAYASMKLLALRCAWRSFDLVLLGLTQSERLAAIASTLGDCADQFVGACLHDWAWIHELSPPGQPPGAALQRLVAEHFGSLCRPDLNSRSSAAGAEPVRRGQWA